MAETPAQAKNKLPEMNDQTEGCVPVAEIVCKAQKSAKERVFGVLGDKKIVVDEDWARPQNDLDAWLRGDV